MKTEKLMAIIDRVVKDKVEVTIRITPDEEEITVEPWKPYEMKCPYQPETGSSPYIPIPNPSIPPITFTSKEHWISAWGGNPIMSDTPVPYKEKWTVNKAEMKEAAD